MILRPVRPASPSGPPISKLPVGLMKQGSQYWVSHPTVPLKKVVAMLNMDMIGRMRKNKLEIGGMRTGGGFEEVCKRLAKAYGFEVVDGGGGRGPSDHESFFNKGIPVLFMFTGLHKQYHQPEDDAALINAEGGSKVAQFTADIAYEISSWKNRPEFKKDTTPEQLLNPGEDDKKEEIVDKRPTRRDGQPRGETPAEAPRRDAATPAGGVRLGVRPAPSDDEAGKGVLVDEVLDDSPAKRAGIQEGDRIVKMGKTSIKDVAGLRKALSELKEGDSVKMVIDRDGESETLTVRFGAAKKAEAGDAAKDRDNAEARRDSRARGAEHGEKDSDARPQISVRMGIAPKYGAPDEKAEGFAFEYVSEGGPAAKAGMRDTDIILSIGEYKVTDIHSYMAALSHFKPGDEVKVAIKRGSEKMELKVKLEAAAAAREKN